MLSACLAIATSTIMFMLPWQNFSIRVKYFLVQSSAEILWILSLYNGEESRVALGD